MAGVLALHDINIRSADFHLWRDNIEIHCYHTDSPPDTLYIEELWARVRRALRYALTGKLSLDFRIREKLSSPLSPKSPDMGLRAQVLADNATSRYYTILEVRAGDRIGLLYDIALALQSQGLQVHLAKIDTQGLAVRDVFYVRDAQGLKIQDQARIDGLSRTLTERIGTSGVNISSRPA
jgi:[protein-PII] uridylyltransferase